jgi:hypothetical protein
MPDSPFCIVLILLAFAATIRPSPTLRKDPGISLNHNKTAGAAGKQRSRKIVVAVIPTLISLQYYVKHPHRAARWKFTPSGSWEILKVQLSVTNLLVAYSFRRDNTGKAAPGALRRAWRATRLPPPLPVCAERRNRSRCQNSCSQIQRQLRWWT